LLRYLPGKEEAVSRPRLNDMHKASHPARRSLVLITCLRRRPSDQFDATCRSANTVACSKKSGDPIGGGAEGIGRALKEAGRPREVAFVGHGLSPDTRAMPIDRTTDDVITQNPQTSLMDCVAIFANLRAGRAPADGNDPLAH
jgi:hypothetical protein